MQKWFLLQHIQWGTHSCFHPPPPCSILGHTPTHSFGQFLTWNDIVIKKCCSKGIKHLHFAFIIFIFSKLQDPLRKGLVYYNVWRTITVTTILFYDACFFGWKKMHCYFTLIQNTIQIGCFLCALTGAHAPLQEMQKRLILDKKLEMKGL